MPEHSPNKTSTPIKVEDPNQFAPQGSDPKELKSKHKEVCMKRASITCDIRPYNYLEKSKKEYRYCYFIVQIRKDYYEERVHAGPQSRVLEGMTWEEAQAAKVRNISLNYYFI